MTTTELKREVAADGSVELRAGRCTYRFRRHAPGVLEIDIEGLDNGQFGRAALDEVALALVRHRPLELFFDTTRASMPAVGVSREWAQFFALNRKDLARVSVLVGSKSVELTIAIAQHLSQTGKLIQIYSDADLYAARKAAAVG